MQTNGGGSNARQLPHTSTSVSGSGFKPNSGCPVEPQIFKEIDTKIVGFDVAGMIDLVSVSPKILSALVKNILSQAVKRSNV